MNRRTALGLISLGTLALTSGVYMEIDTMEKPERKNGRILADLHCHPPKGKDLDETLESLVDKCAGLTFEHHKNISRILTYELATELPGVKEKEAGMAELNHAGKKGYLFRTQEVLADYHLLVIGMKDYLPNFDDARKAVEEARKQDAIVILNHPYVSVNIDSVNPPLVPCRLINSQEEEKLKELCQMVDEIEVFNAQNVNLYIPGVPNMHKANDLARRLAPNFGFKGTAASDAHFRLEQVGISGIYLPEEDLCLEALREHLRKKNFDRHEQYVPRWSFAAGMLLKS